MALGDWWQNLINRAEPAPAPRPAPKPTTTRSSATNMFAGSVVMNKRPGVSRTAAAPNDYPAQTRALYGEGLGIRNARPTATTTRRAPAAPAKTKPDYGAQTRNLYREGLGIKPTPGKPREPGPDYGAQTRDLYREGLGIDPKPAAEKREPWTREDLAALDAKTSARVDNEFARETRAQRLGSTREMSEEEYAALSPRQKAAVQFNAGLVDAARADDAAGNDDTVRNFLASLGTQPKENELTSFLRLDQLIGESILAKLDDVGLRQQSTESMRWARGDTKAAGSAATFMRARDTSDRATEALAQLLSTTGGRRLGDTTTRPGFGQTARDQVIRESYTYMIDSRYQYSPDEIAQGLQEMNAQAGTDVSMDELWDYVRSNVDAVDFHVAGNNKASLPAPTEAFDKTPLIPLDVAEIRRRYGI